MAVRDRLRRDAEARAHYGELKKALATQFPHSIDNYVAGKTAFILSLLEATELEPGELEAIRAANQLPEAE